MFFSDTRRVPHLASSFQLLVPARLQEETSGRKKPAAGRSQWQEEASGRKNPPRRCAPTLPKREGEREGGRVSISLDEGSVKKTKLCDCLPAHPPVSGGSARSDGVGSCSDTRRVPYLASSFQLLVPARPRLSPLAPSPSPAPLYVQVQSRTSGISSPCSRT